ncbi:MAG: BrnT family toxin [Caldilineaceae bacterium]|nr:BrnT family toxin [Caldilineaceae bacterium]
MRYEFEWDPIKERANIRSHGINFRRAASVFRDPQQLTIFDDEHSIDEDRWITMGIDSGGIVRVVVHTFDELAADVYQVRIISARKAEPHEIEQYQNNL